MIRFIFHPLLLLIFFAPFGHIFVRAEETSIPHSCSISTYTRNSTYETNLRTVLSTLKSQTSVSNGFYRAFEGADADNAVTGYALCRGDISQSECTSCINFSVPQLLHLCPDNLSAAAWYDNCMITYSPSSIPVFTPSIGFLEMMDQVQDPAIDPSDLGSYFTVRVDLLSTLAERASKGNSTLKFAAGEMSFAISGKIYALLQCVPDLSEEQCAQCLRLAAPLMFLPAQEYRALTLACNLRISRTKFYNISGYAPEPYSFPLPEPRNDGIPMEDNTGRNVVLIAVLSVCCLLLISFICVLVCLIRRKEKITSQNRQSSTASLHDLHAIRVETDDQRPERHGDAAAPPRNVRPIMEIPMLRDQSVATHDMSSNIQDGTSRSGILKTPINSPSPR